MAAQEQLAINPDQLKEQQDAVKVMKQDVDDHKPLLDRLNKTGGALVKLLGDAEGEELQHMVEDDNLRFDGIRSGMRERSNSLEEALQQTSEVVLLQQLLSPVKHKYSNQKSSILTENEINISSDVHSVCTVLCYPDRIQVILMT